MKNLLHLFLEPRTNGAEITFLLAELLNVKISSSTIKKEFEEHPNYPSLLSISDILSNYGVENLSVRITPEKLQRVPVPFITQIKGTKDDADFFTIVKQITDGRIQYFDPEKHRWDTKESEEFLQRCSGVVLLTDVQSEAGEKTYVQKTQEERRKHMIQNITAFWPPIAILATGLYALVQTGISALVPCIFMLVTLIGSMVSLLLFWYELDQYNPVLQQLCGARKKVNCGAVLQSKGAKIGGVSWSTIGLSYFAGTLIIQLFWGVANPKTLVISAWLNIIAIPYVGYSIYYQWRIAKQWCVLCLYVQSILVLQLGLALLGGWHVPLAVYLSKPDLLIQMTAAFAIPFTVVTILLPAQQQAKEKKQTFHKLQRLKHDPQIFEALLEKQKKLTRSPQGLGILIGNPDATCKIIKVCNPYCGPCALAHVPMEELLNNNPDVQIQIIFFVKSEESDSRSYPVKHLLAIAEKNDQPTVKRALDDWYLAEHKDYSKFAARYPMNGELKQQDKKIDDMEAWCTETGVEFTPTFFISGPGATGEEDAYYQLPEMYTVADLKYFLSV